MKNYNEQLDELFKEWETASKANGDGEISKDGLMRKPDADVNELWAKSQKKIMFLLKDQPNGWGDDTRNWLVSEHPVTKRNREAKTVFLKRLALLLYGFTYNAPDYAAIDKKEMVKCWNEMPFAFVEAKKQSGYKSVTDETMNQYIGKYKDFLLKEIDILGPNIIVCCGRPQYDFTLNTLCKKEDLVCMDENVYYDKIKNMLLIYSWHPSYWRVSDADFYANVMNRFTRFLKQITIGDIENCSREFLDTFYKW